MNERYSDKDNHNDNNNNKDKDDSEIDGRTGSNERDPMMKRKKFHLLTPNMPLPVIIISLLFVLLLLSLATQLVDLGLILPTIVIAQPTIPERAVILHPFQFQSRRLTVH